MSIRIEDCFEDVIAKAQAGLGLSDAEVAKATGVSEETIASLKDGEFDADAVNKVAPALKLDAASVVALAEGSWAPSVEAPEGLLCYNTPFPVPGYEEMTVNAYLVYDPATKQAIAFDTGADASGMLADIKTKGLSLQLVLLTHTHADHIKDLLSLKEATGASALVPEKESVAGARPFTPGEEFTCGELSIKSVETSGHSAGGTTFIIEGLSVPVAIVGDAIFAGSMGGASDSWESALKMIREGILSLPDNTVLCPGHGPLTSVAEEKAHNPIFPEFK